MKPSAVAAAVSTAPEASESEAALEDGCWDSAADFTELLDELSSASRCGKEPVKSSGTAATVFSAVSATNCLCPRGEFGRLWRNRAPLVFTDGLSSCTEAWGEFAVGWNREDSFEALLSAVPDNAEVACFTSPLDGKSFLKRGGICQEERLEWREAALRAIRPNSARAYTRASLSDLSPEALQLLRTGPLEDMIGSPLHPRLCGIWVSSPGCVTPLHFDTCHGLLCQVRGEKRVLLADPLSTRSLYLNAPDHPNPQSSRVNLTAWLEEEAGDQRRLYPKVSNVDWYEVVLNPGQALYIPPLWWHHVETLSSPSVSVLLPFDPDPGEVHHPCGEIV